MGLCHIPFCDSIEHYKWQRHASNETYDMNFHSKTHDSEDDMMDEAEYETRSHSDTNDKPATRKMMKTTCSERDNRMITVSNDNENI